MGRLNPTFVVWCAFLVGGTTTGVVALLGGGADDAAVGGCWGWAWVFLKLYVLVLVLVAATAVTGIDDLNGEWDECRLGLLELEVR